MCAQSQNSKRTKKNGIHPQVGSVRCGFAHWCGSTAMPPLSIKARPLRVRQTMMLTKNAGTTWQRQSFSISDSYSRKN